MRAWADPVRPARFSSTSAMVRGWFVSRLRPCVAVHDLVVCSLLAPAATHGLAARHCAHAAWQRPAAGMCAAPYKTSPEAMRRLGFPLPITPEDKPWHGIEHNRHHQASIHDVCRCVARRGRPDLDTLHPVPCHHLPLPPGAGLTATSCFSSGWMPAPVPGRLHCVGECCSRSAQVRRVRGLQ